LKRDKWLYSLLAVGSFFFTPKGLTWDMGLPKFYYASVLLALIFIFEALNILRNKKNLSIHVYFLFPMAFGVYAIVSTFFIDIPEVFFSSLGFAITLLIFISFSLLISKKDIPSILWFLQWVVFSGAVIAIDALVSFYTGKSFLWGNVFNNTMSRGNISSLIGNVNFTTDLMGMLIPFTIFLAVVKRKLWKHDRLRKITFSVFFTLFLSVVMAGQTRGVYLALLGALILSIIGIALARLKGVQIMKASHLPTLMFIVAITLLLVIGYSTDSPLTRGAFQITERIGNISGDKTSIDVRMLQWKAAIEQWNSKKLTGTGFGTYKFYSTENMARVVSVEPKYMYVNGLLSIRTHDEFLQMLAETGILGVCLIALSLLGFAWYFFRNLFAQSEPEKLLLFLASTAAFVVILLHSVVSFPGHLMPNALIAVFAVGVATSEQLRGFKPWSVVVQKKFVRTIAVLLMLLVPLGGTVLMSRNYFSEAYFTKGYLEKLKFDAASAAIPDLRNTIGKIKVDLSNSLATDTYIDSNLPVYKSRYPHAPEAFLVSILHENRIETVKNIKQKLMGNLKKVANSLMNAQNQGNTAFYNALYYLEGALTFEDHSNLRLFNLPDPMKQLNDFFNGINGYNEKIDVSSPRPLIKPLLTREKRHLPLKELPDLIKAASQEASLTTILKELDMSLLFDYQANFDSLDMAIASFQIVPDPKVFRFAVNQLFYAFSKSESVLEELDKLEKYLDSSSQASLENLKNRIANISNDYRWQFEYLYDTAIHWGIPDDSFNTLYTFANSLNASELKTKIMTLYEPAYIWNKMQAESFYNEKITTLEEGSDAHQRYLDVLERMKAFVDEYESRK